MLSLSEVGLRLWKCDESIVALLQSWIRFLLQSPKTEAAETLGCETCSVRTWISPKATEVILFGEISLTGEYSGMSSSLDTGLQWQVFWFITGTGNILINVVSWPIFSKITWHDFVGANLTSMDWTPSEISSAPQLFTSSGSRHMIGDWDVAFGGLIISV